MKINVLRQLLIPWLLLFVAIIAAIVVGGVKYHIDIQSSKHFIPVLGFLVFICFFLNFNTVSRAGIWIAYSVPKYLQPKSGNWVKVSVTTIAVVAIFYLIGQLSWVPLFWQGFVIPGVFTVGLIVILRSFLGPVLSFSSRVTFTRLTAIFLSVPIFAVVPVSGTFLGGLILKAYLASRSEPGFIAPASAAILEKKIQNKEKIDETVVDEDSALNIENPKSERGQKYKELALAKKPCLEDSKEIHAALQPKTSDELLYWAIKASSCTSMKSVIGMTKMVDIMMKAKNPKVRAAAISAMPRFGQEDVRRVGYLLVKRLSDKEAPEVIEATATVLFRLGENEYKWTMSRLKDLLGHPVLYRISGEVLVKVLKRSDVVIDYIVKSLPEKGPSQIRAAGMICSLPTKDRIAFTPYVQEIVAAIKTGEKSDPAKAALDCLGESGVKAIREEVVQSKILNKSVAARTLYEMDIEHSKEALETMGGCAGDSNTDVRKWCSQGLGKVGALALPKIVELLRSSNDDFKKAGEQALLSFQDPLGKQELLKLRSENSGWMVNQKRLQMAKAIDSALLRIKDAEGPVESEIVTDKAKSN